MYVLQQPSLFIPREDDLDVFLPQNQWRKERASTNKKSLKPFFFFIFDGPFLKASQSETKHAFNARTDFCQEYPLIVENWINVTRTFGRSHIIVNGKPWSFSSSLLLWVKPLMSWEGMSLMRRQWELPFTYSRGLSAELGLHRPVRF